MKKLRYWLLLLFLLLPCTTQAELNIYLSGNVDTQLRYTPEKKLETLKQIYTDITMEGQSGGMKLAVRFDPYGDPMTWTPLTGSFPNFSLQLRRITLSTTAPVYFGGSPAVVSMGDIAVNYSPFIAQMDDTIQVASVLYNPMPRGISLSELIVPLGGRHQLRVDAFALWDRNSESQRMSKAQGVGAKLSGNLAGVDFTWIQTWRGDEEEAGKSISVTDDAFLLEAKRETENSLFWLQYGRSGKKVFELDFATPASQTGGWFGRVRFEGAANESVRYGLEYRNIDAGFDPLYRDRSPRFNEEGKALKWNPLDAMRYVTGLDNWDAYGQKQYLASISLRGENQAADLELAWRSLTGNGTLPDAGVRSLAGSYQTTAGDFNLRVRGKIQELSRTGVNSVTGTDYGHQIGFEISRSMGNMTATYRWQREGLIAGYLGSWQRLLLERPLTANLKLAAGIRQDELINDGKLSWLFGLDYATPQGFELEYRWSSQNAPEDAARLYGPEGLEYVGYDNIFRMGLKTTF